MRRALWMALALVGTTPLVAVAQGSVAPGTPSTQQQPPSQLPPLGTAASPTGAGTLAPAQDPVGTGFFGVPGQLPPALPSQGDYLFGTGGSGMGDLSGTTYRGTPPESPSATPPVNTATGTDTGTVSPGTVGAGTQVPGSVAGQVPRQDELNDLRQRVSALERELGALRGTGGAGTQPSGTNVSQPANTPAGTQPGVAQPATQPGVTQPADTTGGKGEGGSESAVLATAEFDGRVQSVTSKHIDIVDSTDGTVSRLLIDEKTKVSRGNKRVKATRLSEGTPVRASFALMSGTGEERALSIVALPRKQAPRK